MNNRWIIVVIIIFIIFTLLCIVVHPTIQVPIIETVDETYPIPENGLITQGYYHIPDSNLMKLIPFGFKVKDPDISGNGLLVVQTEAEVTSSYRKYINDEKNGLSASLTDTYDKNDLSKRYHGDPTEEIDSWKITDSSGIASVPSRYYPGESNRSYSPKYVPNYEDSIYLSTTKGQTQASIYTDEIAESKGFCANKTVGIDDIDKNCNALEKSSCASTTCCVLIGNKCVSGNEYGPLSKATYIDPFLKNKDSYYYEGKCYGNCDDSKPAQIP